ncbi:C2 domain-containing protein 5 isoform X3 [Neocloeon triangulifer]|uniref:C2 domain-containing protein 5 isoform X3 n=1 Tax=Neocloeon triangulifer TaxID=2078957 RepID=UPI00286F129E|nr:C2 domain-containing protein 5 isoform X3 [Neocloeon triangulifer]
MPGKVKVKIIAGRNLPVMDRSADTTDAYVEIKMSNITHKTDVCRKSLNPQWTEEWHRFEVDDTELQDEPLQIRLMDYDVYSANDAIGKVYIDLNPLIHGSLDVPDTCVPQVRAPMLGGAMSYCGWFPVYDTMHGIRGEVQVIVKIELFSDTNKFRDSSHGIKFFCTAGVPHGLHALYIHGFVEELILTEDPEYEWLDKIRTPRATNEARQTLFFKLSGEVKRRVGLKALEMGANSVIGYRLQFDLEGESGIVARGIGTAVTLVSPLDTSPNTTLDELPFPSAAPPVHGLDSTDSSSYLDDEQQQRLGHSNGSNTLSPSRITNNIQRRSSDSDLSITPKGNSFGSGGSANNRQFHRHSIPRPILNQDSSIDLLEYPFLTLNKYPAGFIIRFGGMVCARSVKLLERNTEEPESRDLWWHELRMEVRSHARALACNVVLGYREESSISDDVCILSATGTAAVVNMHHRDGSRISSRKFKTRSTKSKDTDTSNVSEENEDEKQTSKINIENFNKFLSPQGRRSKVSLADGQSPLPPQCTMCHVPYSLANSPMPVNAIRCAVCKKGKVPDVLLTTVEIPEEAMLTGRGCLVQVQVCRTKKDAKGEHNAKEISDSLPFLEYDMYSAIINKLRVKGMNAVFNLRVSVTVGDRLLVGIASGTAVFLTPMPAPPIPKLTASKNNNSRLSLAEVQKRLQDACRNNREIYGVIPNQEKDCNSESDSEESDEDLPALELASGNKDACIIEVDDSEDMNAVNLLIESSVPHGFEVVNTETIPGLTGFEVVSSLQMFTQVWRARVNPCQNSSYSFSLNKHIRRLQQSLYFKLRKMVPCGLLRLRFKVELPDADEIQITILGMAVGLGKVPQPLKSAAKLKTNCKKEDSDLIFKLDDEVVAIVTPPPAANIRDKKQNPFYLGYTNLLKNSHDPPTGRYGVDITPLSYVPGAKIEEYLGNLNFFFIRESNSIREIGGYSNFVHGFINELLAIVRAHITALGGNAMVSYYMNEFTLLSAAHKNQGQCLIQVGGDAVRVSYPAAEKQQ